MRTVLAAAAVVLVATACLAPSRPAQTAPAVQQARSASALWDQNCANCHGTRGQGGGAGTQTLNKPELLDQDLDKRFFDAIKNGVPDTGMTAFGETLTDEQIWSLVVHTRELQARAMPPRVTNADKVNRTARASFRVETVFDGPQLDTPWSVDWLPDGRMLVTSRSGTMAVVKDGRLVGEVSGLPAVVELGQGGLMDVAVGPDYAESGWIYLSYTEPSPTGARRGGMTRIVRGKLKWTGQDPRWTEQQTLWSADPDSYTASGVHFGCRIVFDGKGNLFFAVGERGNGSLAQDLSKPNGKVYRIRLDGSIPPDNPFVGREGALPAVWSYGHRNPQGLAFALDGTLWDTEHGPRGGDELNRIEKGANYGWPDYSFGINYSDAPYKTPWPPADAGITMPVYRWIPSVGACGLDVVRGPMFPAWKGDFMAGGLSGQSVDRIRLREGKFVEFERVLSGLGRVRDVVCAPDGSIYVVLNEPDKVVRLVELD